MTNDSACDHCRDLLPEYAAGTLLQERRAQVERHLAVCVACTRELQAWDALAGAVRKASQAATPRLPFEASFDLLAARLAQTQPDSSSVPQSVALGLPTDEHTPQSADIQAARSLAVFAALTALARHIVRVTGGQMRLLRPAVWLASAIGIALAVVYALTLPHVIGERDMLAIALPLIAATGTAFLYGPEVDAGLELALATPTSPRVVLISRFALLFGYDAALALIGTLLLATARNDGFASVAAVWLGPMALLSTLSLALSLVLGPAVAVGGAAALWLSRALSVDNSLSLHLSGAGFWPTTPQIIALSLALLAFALLYVPRQQRLRSVYDA